MKILQILSLTIFSLLISINSSKAAEKPTFEIIIKDHKFEPDRIVIPKNQKVKLIVHNQDKTIEEFESHDLKREKIIAGGKKATIYVGPIKKPGTYKFFGEFNPKTAQGVLVVE